MAAKEFIVAIELGSSKITGVAGRKNSDGSITILAEAKEDSSSFINRGTVYKVPQTIKGINDILTKLKQKLKQDISKVYVGIGGQSIHSVRNQIIEEFEEETRVTSEMIDQMWDKNRETVYQDQMITTAIPQEYRVDNNLEVDPEGIQCSRLEGNFLNILCREKFFSTLTQCFKEAKVPVVDTYLSPLPLADSVLMDNEKNSGCVLVDIGAGTTTVSVYYKNILRHLAVIPLGGNNITKDISSLKVDESVAEELKFKYGNAYADENEIDDEKLYEIDSERSVKSTEFIRIVEGRLREIIENVWHQVPSDYAEKLLGGLIITGGVSNMKNIDQAFREYTPMKKIRIAKFVTQSILSNAPDVPARDGTMNTVLGILAKGDENCAGAEINAQEDLFNDPKIEEQEQEPPLSPAKEPTRTTGGVISAPPVHPSDEEQSKMDETKGKDSKEQNKSFGQKLKKFFDSMLKEDE